MSIEDLAGKGIYFSPDKGAGGQPLEPPADNTSEAADLIDRAQFGDSEALMQILNMDKPLFVDDMPGKLAEFDGGKAEGVKGNEGK